MKFRIGSRDVATYQDGQDLAPELSPRPFLHPVRTLEGVCLTEIEPQDHPHHLGVSNAVVEINGTMFWGGPTYSHPTGYSMLANHGRQVGGPLQATDHDLHQRVDFRACDGGHLLTEERHLSADLLPTQQAWALTWRSRMTADTIDLRIGSPATRGRTGAGYGGLFWRLSHDRIATTATVDGGAEPSGSTSPWLLLTQQRSTGPVSLLLAQPATRALPWFVRTRGYVGAGPAVAWQSERRLPLGQTLPLTLSAVLADRILTARDAATIYDTLEHMW